MFDSQMKSCDVANDGDECLQNQCFVYYLFICQRWMSSGQTLGVKAQRFRGHTSPHRNVKENIATILAYININRYVKSRSNSQVEYNSKTGQKAYYFCPWILNIEQEICEKQCVANGTKIIGSQQY
eukprot:TRINITY_DN322_c0_g1_i3.p4 TRINITY_DN322_c0_g1~~TRINITY_DN322_c0_g1_i3.p4  ORF type:complete len:126 (+),score=8.11 TRINITY_DN322_c0_g1_i3:443-820(+)